MAALQRKLQIGKGGAAASPVPLVLGLVIYIVVF